MKEVITLKTDILLKNSAVVAFTIKELNNIRKDINKASIKNKKLQNEVKRKLDYIIQVLYQHSFIEIKEELDIILNEDKTIKELETPVSC